MLYAERIHTVSMCSRRIPKASKNCLFQSTFSNPDRLTQRLWDSFTWLKWLRRLLA